MAKVRVRLMRPGQKLRGLLTTEHAASSYGQPVLVIKGHAYGPSDEPHTYAPYVLASKQASREQWHMVSRWNARVRQYQGPEATAEWLKTLNPDTLIPRRWTSCQVLRTRSGQVKVKLPGTVRRRSTKSAVRRRKR
jgi:hypothetical protein